jgi:hypothetical protein
MRYTNDVPPPHQRNTPPNARTNNSHTASHDTDDAIAPNQQTLPPIHTRISMRNRRSEKAQAVTHSVNTTQQRTIPRYTAKKAEWHPNTTKENNSHKAKRKGDNKIGRDPPSTDDGGDKEVGGDLSSMDDGGDNDLSITSDDEDSISATGEIGDSAKSAEELGSHVENKIQ